MAATRSKRPFYENIDADDDEEDFEKPDYVNDQPQNQPIASEHPDEPCDRIEGEHEPPRRLLTCPELAEIVRTTPIMEPLVKDLISQRSLGILVGRWGLGKSPLLIQLALSITFGLSFLGNYETKESRVLYIDFENGPELMNNVIDRLCQFLKVERPANLFIKLLPEYLSRGKMIESLERDIVGSQAALVIIDPLRAFSINAEATNSDAQQFIAQLREVIKRTHASVLLTHHIKKTDRKDESNLTDNPEEWLDRACGASALISNTDFRIGIDKARNPDELLVRSYQRMRGWEPVQTLIRVRDEDGSPLGYRIAQGVDRLDSRDKHLLDCLEKHFSTARVKSLSGLTNSPVNDKLKSWARLGIIKSICRGEWGKVDQSSDGAGCQTNPTKPQMAA